MLLGGAGRAPVGTDSIPSPPPPHHLGTRPRQWVTHVDQSHKIARLVGGARPPSVAKAVTCTVGLVSGVRSPRVDRPCAGAADTGAVGAAAGSCAAGKWGAWGGAIGACTTANRSGWANAGSADLRTPLTTSGVHSWAHSPLAHCNKHRVFLHRAGSRHRGRKGRRRTQHGRRRLRAVRACSGVRGVGRGMAGVCVCVASVRGKQLQRRAAGSCRLTCQAHTRAAVSVGRHKRDRQQPRHRLHTGARREAREERCWRASGESK